jgi:hypothetical protein
MRRWEENFEKHPVHESLEHPAHWLDVDSTKPQRGLYGFRSICLRTLVSPKKYL